MFVCSKCKIDISQLDGAISGSFQLTERFRLCPKSAKVYASFPKITLEEFKKWIGEPC